MLKAVVALSVLLVVSHHAADASGLRTLFELQHRVFISESDMTTLLLAAGTPQCLRPCINGLVQVTSESFSFNGSMVTTMEKTCKEYKSATSCVKKAKCHRATAIYDIFTKGLEAACGENFHLIYFVKPCLDQFAEVALTECDAKCEWTGTLERLTQDPEVKELAMKGGNAMKLLQHLGPTCSSMLCFLSCSHKELNAKCPITGNAFVEVSLKPMEHVAEKMKGASQSLKNMVRKKLPEQCQPLLDIDYLNRLKAFGTPPEGKPATAI